MGSHALASKTISMVGLQARRRYNVLQSYLSSPPNKIVWILVIYCCVTNIPKYSSSKWRILLSCCIDQVWTGCSWEAATWEHSLCCIKWLLKIGPPEGFLFPCLAPWLERVAVGRMSPYRPSLSIGLAWVSSQDGGPRTELQCFCWEKSQNIASVI